MKSPWKTPSLELFTGTFTGPMRMPFKHRSLSVHRTQIIAACPGLRYLPDSERTRFPVTSRTPLRIQLFDARTMNFFAWFRTTRSPLLRLPEFAISKPSRVEIFHQSKRTVRVPMAMEDPTESLASHVVGIAGSDVIEPQFRQIGRREGNRPGGAWCKLSRLPRQGSTKEKEATRGGRKAWDKKHREFIDEIAVGELAPGWLRRSASQGR